MTVITTSHIVLDDRGVAYIDGQKIRVIQIVLDTLGGLTPEKIHEQYSYLSLAEIHAALAYYYDHQTELDAQITHEKFTVAAVRQEAIQRGNQPTRAELEARLRDTGGR